MRRDITLSPARALGVPRICIRIGCRRWAEKDGHTLVYWCACTDPTTDTVLMWDLTTDTEEEVPRLTVTSRGQLWTRKPTHDEQENARDRVVDRLGTRVEVVKRW